MTAPAAPVRARPAAAPAAGRLMYVVNDLPFFVSHRLPLAAAARAAGFEVHVAVPLASGDPAPLAALGCRLHDIALDRRGMDPAAEARLAGQLLRLYRRERPDVVHHVTVKPVLYGSLAARVARVPRVINAVTGLGYLHAAVGLRAAAVRAAARGLYRLALNRPGVRVVFQNADDRATFVDAGVLAPERAVLVPGGSGVDLRRFAPRPVPPGPPVVMLPARMLWDKGVGEFVDAARLVRAQRPDARFVLVGDTDVNRAAVPRARLAAWAEEGAVEWWGRRVDMPATLAEAAVVVLPSYREGCPKVLLEAAACGRPIVTTDVPGCRDVVGDGVEGRVVPARDAGALAQAVLGLLDDPAGRAACGARARARAEAEFDVARVAAAHLALYSGRVPAA